MSGNILFLGNKIFEIPPFFQTRPGDLGKKVRACSLRFYAPLEVFSSAKIVLLTTVLETSSIAEVISSRANLL